MKPSFKKYLKDIGIETSLQQHVDKIISFYAKEIGIKAEDIFVSEQSDKNNRRTYENLWIFSKNYMCECKNFTTKITDHFDLAPWVKIGYWGIKKQNYWPGDVGKESRLIINFSFNQSTVGGIMKASSDNCEQLFSIFKKYIMANLL